MKIKNCRWMLYGKWAARRKREFIFAMNKLLKSSHKNDRFKSQWSAQFLSPKTREVPWIILNTDIYPHVVSSPFCKCIHQICICGCIVHFIISTFTSTFLMDDQFWLYSFIRLSVFFNVRAAIINRERYCVVTMFLAINDLSQFQNFHKSTMGKKH